MPIYEYECRKCKAHIEVFQKMNARPRVRCRKCRGRLEKLLSPPAIQFKGEGWYVTDYARKGQREPEKPAPEPAAADKKKDGPKKAGSIETTSSKPANSD